MMRMRMMMMMMTIITAHQNYRENENPTMKHDKEFKK
jgi:hypothetical protein